MSLFWYYTIIFFRLITNLQSEWFADVQLWHIYLALKLFIVHFPADSAFVIFQGECSVLVLLLRETERWEREDKHIHTRIYILEMAF